MLKLPPLPSRTARIPWTGRGPRLSPAAPRCGPRIRREGSRVLLHRRRVPRPSCRPRLTAPRRGTEVPSPCPSGLSPAIFPPSFSFSGPSSTKNLGGVKRISEDGSRPPDGAPVADCGAAPRVPRASPATFSSPLAPFPGRRRRRISVWWGKVRAPPPPRSATLATLPRTS